MTIPILKQEELIKLLKDNGCKIVSDSDWDTHNRVIFEKSGHTFPFQLKSVYKYHYVVKLCQSLEIPSPEEHQKFYDQTIAQLKLKNGETND